MITVSFAGQEKNATAWPDGKWMAYLDPMACMLKPVGIECQSTDPNQKD